MSRVARNRAESEIEAEMFSSPAQTSLVTSMSSSPIASSVDVYSVFSTSSKGVASASDSHSDSHQISSSGTSLDTDGTASDMDGTASDIDGTALDSDGTASDSEWDTIVQRARIHLGEELVRPGFVFPPVTVETPHDALMWVDRGLSRAARAIEPHVLRSILTNIDLTIWCFRRCENCLHRSRLHHERM